MGCCEQESVLSAQDYRQKRTLIYVLIINALMFAVIIVASWLAASSALFADAFDNLGDAITYAVSLYAVSRSNTIKAKVAVFKGCLILLGGLLVLGQVGYKLFNPAVPIFELMGLFSLIALGANALCLLLLSQHRHEDVNMSSVWACSRNDIVANLSVFVAAALVWFTQSGWPDLLVATLLALYLLRSGFQVIHSARENLTPSCSV
ncbi:MAG: cation transporter [Proteobacteria bacterium]|nr:MAG: cation transporter [Pseudomonadota bacterium]